MKTSNLITVAVALAAAAISMPAAAQSKGFEPGFYIGAGLGQSHVSGQNGAFVVGPNTYVVSGFDSNKTTFQINGGYQFTEIWGLEVQYTDGGDRSGTIRNNTTGAVLGTQDVRAYQIGISGTGTYMFTPEWFARGKLGISSNHLADLNVTLPGGGAYNIGGSNHTDVLAGIGVGYKWNQNFSTRLEYEYFGKFETSGGATSNGTGSNWGLRMQYKF
jgi:opacity protein-like surface antigen